METALVAHLSTPVGLRMHELGGIRTCTIRPHMLNHHIGRPVKSTAGSITLAVGADTCAHDLRSHPGSRVMHRVKCLTASSYFLAANAALPRSFSLAASCLPNCTLAHQRGHRV